MFEEYLAKNRGSLHGAHKEQLVHSKHLPHKKRRLPLKIKRLPQSQGNVVVLFWLQEKDWAEIVHIIKGEQLFHNGFFSETVRINLLKERDRLEIGRRRNEA